MLKYTGNQTALEPLSFIVWREKKNTVWFLKTIKMSLFWNEGKLHFWLENPFSMSISI